MRNTRRGAVGMCKGPPDFEIAAVGIRTVAFACMPQRANCACWARDQLVAVIQRNAGRTVMRLAQAIDDASTSMAHHSCICCTWDGLPEERHEVERLFNSGLKGRASILRQCNFHAHVLKYAAARFCRRARDRPCLGVVVRHLEPSTLEVEDRLGAVTVAGDEHLGGAGGRQRGDEERETSPRMHLQRWGWH